MLQRLVLTLHLAICAARSPMLAVAGSGSQGVAVAVPDLGSLEGRLSSYSREVALFNGIPYAAPPVGDLRWRPPKAHGPWQSPRDASSFGARCFGLDRDPLAAESEDCLFLNVAAPLGSLSGKRRLPVMVYIHGGAYTGGASNHNHPDVLVARSAGSVVVVTLNYRLNLFGFLASATLAARSSDGSTGNYGIQDQRLALVWVRDHIAAFGGDGGDVTVFGESAGGNSILQHLTQPASFGLYRKAILESGDYNATWGLADAEPRFRAVLLETQCVDVDCLLRVSAPELLGAARRVGKWGPVIDGVSLRSYPAQLLARGEYNREVPIMLGSTRDEASLWMADNRSEGWLPPTVSAVNLSAFVAGFFTTLGPAGMEALKKLYAPPSYVYPEFLGNYSQPWWTAMRMVTDGGSRSAIGHCCVRRTARALAKGGSPGVFVYLFAHASSAALYDLNEGTVLPGTGPNSPLVPHASELPYVFGWVEALSLDGGGADLALAMSKYWIRFASTGDPNEASLPNWPRYDPDRDTILHLDAGDTGIRPQQLLRAAACDFWDRQMAAQAAVTAFI